MTALLIAGTAWALLSVPVALLVGGAIAQGDRRSGAAMALADPDRFFAIDASVRPVRAGSEPHRA